MKKTEKILFFQETHWDYVNNLKTIDKSISQCDDSIVFEFIQYITGVIIENPDIKYVSTITTFEPFVADYFYIEKENKSEHFLFTKKIFDSFQNGIWNRTIKYYS